MIGRTQHVRIMLHHKNRVAQIAQFFKDVNQPRGVARVQSDRRLIQHIQRAHQPRAERRRELNPLRLAARQRGSQPVERQVFQADRVKKTQPLAHLFAESVRQSPPASASVSTRQKIPWPWQWSAPLPGRCSGLQAH